MQTIKELAPQIKSGEVSPVKLVEETLEKIRQTNDETKIFITVCEESALQEARKAEAEIAQGQYKGPLHGIPYTLKDLYETKGIKTTGGSKVLADYIPQEDALVVKSLREQGAIMLGKVNQHEFAYGATGENPHYGTVTNPYDPTRLAGGSSSGSGAAVARGLGVFSLGTDTGGSVRVPAALCGVVGLKPTYNLLSCEGVIPYCWSLDHVGPLTKTVYDSKLVMSALTGGRFDELEARESLEGLRIGLPTAFFYEGLDPEIEARVKEVQEMLSHRGAELVPVTMPDMEHTRTVSLILQLPECLSYHSRYMEERGHLYGSDIKAGMAAGQFILAEHYVRARRMLNVYKQQMDRVFEEVDLILTPSTPCIAPKLGVSNVELGGKDVPAGNAVTMFFSFFNMTGNPAITVPCGLHSQGLPMGVQLIGKKGDEETVLTSALTLENILEGC